MEIIVVCGIFGILCAAIASGKGRSTGWWFILGCLFSLLALIAIALLSHKNKTAAPAILAGAEIATPETHVRCPECRELVRFDARRCKHCGITLTPQKPG